MYILEMSCDSKEIWCPLPWGHLEVAHSGRVKLCSYSKLYLSDVNISNMPEDWFNHPDLCSVRRDFINGMWPKSCERCRIDFESGRKSRNLWEKTRLDLDQSHQLDCVRGTNLDGSLNQIKILSMDLRLGNRCNLKCSMCYPGESDQWFVDFYELYGSKFQMDETAVELVEAGGKLKLSGVSMDWIEKNEVFNWLNSHGKNLKSIYFAGGEPLFENGHIALLEGLVQAGQSKGIQLEYNSNMTLSFEKFLPLWENFKEIRIGASVDGYGVVNEAIRYPSSWQVVEKNVLKFCSLPEKFKLHLTSTISLLNVEHFISLLKWADSLPERKETELSLCRYHLVSFPRHLSFDLLSDDQFEDLINFLNKESSGSCSEKVNMEVRRLLKLIVGSRKAQDMNKSELNEERQNLKKLISFFGKKRRQDWSEISPFLSEKIKEWD